MPKYSDKKIVREHYRWLRNIEFGPLPFSMALFFLLGLVLVASMRLDPPSNYTKKESADRDIASVQSPWDLIRPTSVKAVLPGPEEVSLDCSKENKRPPFVSKSPFIRLELTGCDLQSVTNNKNNYEASLFKLNDLRSSTDFISLAEGTNEVVIEALVDEAPVQLRLEIVYQ